jgi:hypothetical protein
MKHDETMKMTKRQKKIKNAENVSDPGGGSIPPGFLHAKRLGSLIYVRAKLIDL